LRACRRVAAGIAWLIDYTVAVALSAWDGASVARPSRRRRAIADEPVIDFVSVEAVRVFPRPGRAMASLALIGVLSVSVVGALWGRPAAPGAPAASELTAQPAARTAEPSATSVLLWAPIIEEEAASDVVIDAAVAPATEPTVVPTPTPEAPTVAPVAAAAVETPTPEPTPEPPPPPTPTPTPEPPPPPPAPKLTGQLTKATVREIALQVGWPEAEVDELVSVAWCESRFRVEANGWGALGLMQIMPFWFESVGIDPAQAFDAATNLKVAYHIYQNDLKNGYDEWASWTCKPVALPASAP
jgi:hypothetical protein